MMPGPNTVAFAATVASAATAASVASVNNNNDDDERILDRDETLSSLPPEWPEYLTDAIAERASGGNETIVVLDDDPTGTQTVYDLPVLTEWSSEIIEDEFDRGTPAFYIMTNSRSFAPADAAEANECIARRLLSAAKSRNRKLSIISRSDSCLRGHYPLETDTLARTLREEADDDDNSIIDGLILAPFFHEGGRLTLNDVHYVAEGNKLMPAARTPFARDAAFGFSRSNVREYVEEKTHGKIRRDDVVSISLHDLREGGPPRVREKLNELIDGRPCVVNAVSVRDMEVFALGMMRAEEEDGKRFLARTAASFVQARIGLPKRPLLGADVINNNHRRVDDDDATKSDGVEGEGKKRGGLVVVGSYVPKTTAQLERLLRIDGLEAIELDASILVDDDARRGPALDDASERAERAVSSGRTAVVYTSRTLLTGRTPSESLSIGNVISDALVRIVSRLDEEAPPRFIIAKGGITSSDVATKGLGIRRAVVLGQAAPGVPVWRIGGEGKFPGTSYVVFPGNVGSNDELAALVERLST
uniref:Hydroxyacid dehydrogenase n=1 Tax=Odontella aurita TaxID=265563 RepID=A0A7S4K7V9_9STRA|mmetsp:Transcript_63198/g.186787  ORF Transcript_63198/g.186787 Transcript_63198/m.186787 type:complete len:533 (+) Transcript_63198:166-1764(+)